MSTTFVTPATKQDIEVLAKLIGCTQTRIVEVAVRDLLDLDVELVIAKMREMG